MITVSKLDPWLGSSAMNEQEESESWEKNKILTTTTIQTHLLIKTVEKESLRINVVHNGCYFKLQEITFITLNNNSRET